MGALVFSLVLQVATVTDGDGAPPGMTAEQEAAWAWANLKPIVVEGRRSSVVAKKPPPPAPMRPARRPATKR